ncbi:MAG: TSUP family transporter [Alphaproteobacteria bacterium]
MGGAFSPPMLALGLSPLTIVLAFTIMAAASVIQATVGMGLALIAVPLLALVEPRFIPGPMLAAGLVVTVAMAYRGRRDLDSKDLGWSVTGLAAGTLAGAAALAYLSGPALPKLFGALVLTAVAISVSGVRVAPTRRAFLIAGGAAGVMGTMVGIHGPPIALVLQNAKPDTIRAMLGAFFTVAGAGAVMALAAVGLFGLQELVLSAILVPGVVAGLLIAPLFGRFGADRAMRISILAFSAAGGVTLILR